MQRIVRSFSYLLGSRPLFYFFFLALSSLFSASLQPRHDLAANSVLGIPVAFAQSLDVTEHGTFSLHDDLESNSLTLQERSEERPLHESPKSLNRKDGDQLYESVRRAEPLEVIANNAPVNQGVRPGDAYYYSFPNALSSPNLLDRSDIDEPGYNQQISELGRRQRTERRQRTVYITVNACSQPQYSSRQDQQNPPQLVLYISQTDSIKYPGPKSDDSQIIIQPLTEGYAGVTLNTTSDIYASVHAPSIEALDDTMWIFDLAASLDEPYHSFFNSSLNLFMIDSDRNAALLITKNLSSGTPHGMDTDKWLSRGPPLSIFVQEKNNTLIKGLHQSYCGLNHIATFPGYNINPRSLGFEFGLTKYGGSSLEQQFYIPNLNATSTYYGILARPSATNEITPGGGGAVYLSMTFHTKAQANCAVVYNLTFCSSIAYAVPANPDKFTSLADLRAIYDSTTASKYQNFNYSLQQIPCNTTSSAQYSLNRTCDDCAAAYKKWLCAVSIPRCADWVPNPDAHKSTSFLQPRNAAQIPIGATPDIPPVMNRTLLDWLATNSSRNNATIAGQIQPGPYAEILPCEDLCYDIVRSCPAAFGFGCPYKGRGLEMSYGKRNLDINGGVTCSEPGAVFGLNGAPRNIPLSMALLWICLTSAVGMLCV